MRNERSLENRIKEFTEVNGGLFIKQNPNIYRGIPDRLVITSTGRIFFVEIKDPEGKISELQRYWIRKLLSINVGAYIVYNLEQFKEVWYVQDARYATL